MADEPPMADEPLPYIEREHYEAICDVVQGLPSTYAEWLEDHKREKLKLEKLGHTFVEVKVPPDEFKDFCRKRGGNITVESLRRFAVENSPIPQTLPFDDDC